MEARRWLRRAAQIGVAALGPKRWRRPRPGLLVLMYHRVLPRGAAPGVPVQPGMFVHADSFEDHLRIVRSHFTPVVLSEWVARARSGRPLPTRACAITFDDGWIDNYLHAFPLLYRYGVPATLFLVSDFVGGARLFWPERLQLFLAAGGGAEDPWIAELLRGETRRDAAAFDRAVQRAKALSDREIDARLDALEGTARAAPERQLFDWDEARRMVESGIIEIGSHTCTHTRLRADLPAHLLEREIVDSQRAIRDRLDREVHLFCYPNGDRCDAARALVARHYRAACTTQKGWNDGAGAAELRRIGIHQGVAHDDTAFTARLSGWL